VRAHAEKTTRRRSKKEAPTPARAEATPPEEKTSRGEKTEATRRAVMKAAMETIEELGYYRASSNEIARRAGYTWGVIQHHFGTREGLMFAVIRQTIEDFLAFMRSAEVSGDTLEARVASMCKALFEVYGVDSYIATLQILLDMAHDPAHAETTREAVAEYQRAFNRESLRLARDVTPDRKVPSRVGDFVTSVVWGLAVAQNVNRVLQQGRQDPTPAARAQIVDAVTAIYRTLPEKSAPVSRARPAARRAKAKPASRS
jgi:AcrR family transcriptional regulator